MYVRPPSRIFPFPTSHPRQDHVHDFCHQLRLLILVVVIIMHLHVHTRPRAQHSLPISIPICGLFVFVVHLLTRLLQVVMQPLTFNAPGP